MTTHPSASSNSPKFLYPDFVLGLAIVPMLGTIVAANAIARATQTVGVLSEEIFRGDRLPVLDFVDPSQSEPPQSS